MLTAGLHGVPGGHVAAIVTYLAMDVAEAAAPSWPDGTTLRPVPTPDATWYKDLFTRVGAQDWLWFSRLMLSDAELTEILHHGDVEVFALHQVGVEVGLLEVDFRPSDGSCNLAFLGLTRAAQGAGLGRRLVAHGVARAWARGARRMTVNTCTLDSAWALPFYLRCGFQPLRREVEIVADPRLDETVPSDAAPHHPVIAP